MKIDSIKVFIELRTGASMCHIRINKKLISVLSKTYGTENVTSEVLIFGKDEITNKYDATPEEVAEIVNQELLL
jgi:hypothetical protein